ncbi:MAG: sensor histidine kinase [Crocinitomicaceae bacterium]
MAKQNDQIKKLKQEIADLKSELSSLKNHQIVDFKWSEKIIDMLPNPLFIKDKNHVYVQLNKAFTDFSKSSKSAMIGKTDHDFFPENESEIFWEKDSQVLETGITNWNEEEITIEEEKFVLLTSKARIFDGHGDAYVLGLITDISESKRLEKRLRDKKKQIELQKENIQILLKEVHHRVKNNLQIVSSLLNMQMTKFDDASIKNAFLDCKNRIMAMAEIHDVLYREETLTEIDFGEYLSSLISNISVAFKANDKIKFVIDVQNLRLAIDTVIPLGLLVNEIVTNSLKHGFRAEKQLEIYIKITIKKSKILLSIGDNGIGMSFTKIVESKGLGMELIAVFCEQLNARCKLHEKKKGVHYKVSFKI